MKKDFHPLWRFGDMPSESFENQVTGTSFSAITKYMYLCLYICFSEITKGLSTTIA